MIKGVSIQRRVVKAFVGLMALAAAFYAGFLLLVAYTVEDEIIARILGDEIHYLQETHASTGELPAPRLPYMQVYASVAQAPTTVSDKLLENPNRREIFTADERHFHVRYLYLSDQSRPLLVAEVSSLLVVTNMSTGVLTYLVIALGLIIGAAIWMAYRIARQTTQPIMQLSDEVQRQHHEHGELVLSAAGQAGEVGYLADVIQSSLKQLRGALKREHHFTRDVSHELRTPLTVMKNTLSLIEDRPADEADIATLAQATHHMQSTVTALLGLARQESQQFEMLSLRPIVEDSVLSMSDALEQLNFEVQVSIPQHVEVYGNEHLIYLLITNLIENAVQYASAPRLDIVSQGAALHFTNAVAAPVIDDPTSPEHKGADSQGLGQGLFLVKRITEVLRWRLSTSTHENVFRVTAYLPQTTEIPNISP